MKTRLVGVLLGVLMVTSCAESQVREKSSMTVQEVVNLDCAPHYSVADQLYTKYREKLFLLGVSENGETIMEIYASNNGKTWSLTFTGTNGISCLAAAGKDLRIKKQGDRVQFLQLLVETISVRKD